jgi:hypothetical protein
MAYEDTAFRRKPDDSDDPAYRNGAGAADYRNRRLDPDGDSPAEPPRRSADDARDRVGIHLGWPWTRC